MAKRSPVSIAAMRQALADWGVPYQGDPHAKTYRRNLQRRYSYMRDALDHGASITDLPRLVSASRGHAGTREHPARQLRAKAAAPARRIKPPVIATGLRRIGAADVYVGGRDTIASQIRFQADTDPSARVVVTVWDMQAGKWRRFFVNQRKGGATGISAEELAARLQAHHGDLRAVLEDAVGAAEGSGGADSDDDLATPLGPIGRWQLTVMPTWTGFTWFGRQEIARSAAEAS